MSTSLILLKYILCLISKNSQLFVMNCKCIKNNLSTKKCYTNSSNCTIDTSQK